VNKSLAKNFEDGHRAFNMVERRNGRFHQVSNPLRKNTTSYREWQRGWEAAYFENLEKLNGTRKRS
jgi:hypothetical protein